MARGINKVILIGTLGKDPETKNFPNGGSLTQFSIATSESWKDKNTGERKEQTEWHRIVLNNRLGEIAQQYLRKGSDHYVHVNGLIKMVKNVTLLKFVVNKCKCWTLVDHKRVPKLA